MSPDHDAVTAAFETAVAVHEEVVAPLKRGQRWGAMASGLVGVVVLIALGLRYVLGLFALFGFEELGGGQVWLGFAFGLGASLASAAFAQVAVGSIGAKLLGALKPPGGG